MSDLQRGWSFEWRLQNKQIMRVEFILGAHLFSRRRSERSWSQRAAVAVGKLSVIYKIKRSRIIYLSIISYGVRYVIFCRTDKIHHYERTRSYVISKAASFHPLGDTTMINAQKKEHATVFFFYIHIFIPNRHSGSLPVKSVLWIHHNTHNYFIS